MLVILPGTLSEEKKGKIDGIRAISTNFTETSSVVFSGEEVKKMQKHMKKSSILKLTPQDEKVLTDWNIFFNRDLYSKLPLRSS